MAHRFLICQDSPFLYINLLPRIEFLFFELIN